jgi:hypothetical protein
VTIPHFELTPYMGLPSLTFGATRAAVMGSLGPPNEAFSPPGSRYLAYPPCLHVVLDAEDLVSEIQFAPGQCVVAIQGHEILTVGADGPRLDLRRLIILDPAPREQLGVLLFFRLGLLTTGFHNREWAQRGFAAFRRGGREDLRRDAPAWDWTWM